MKYWNRHTSNYIILIFFIISAVWLWGSGKSSFSMFMFSPWLFLSQLSAVVSITTLSLTMILSTRITLLWVIFGELQYIYKIHKVSGIVGFTFLILHIVFLLLHSMQNPSLFGYYFIPGSDGPLDLGRISFILFLVVVVTTFVKKIPYNIWKKIHYLSGPAFFLAIWHALAVNSDLRFNQSLRYWSVGLMICGGLSYIYIRFLYKYIGPQAKYKVTKVEKVAKDMYLICMKPLKKQITYNPAQFAFFSFDSKKLGGEVHPFTIITTENSETLKIICKPLGDFTKNIVHLEEGTLVNLWGPYGVFWDEYNSNKREQVWIAGGVGITPFISMLDHETTRPIKTQKWLFYCNRNEEYDLPDEHLSKFLDYTNVKLIKHHSRKTGYLSIETIRKHVPNLKDKAFFICCSSAMVSYLKEKLYEEGVDPNNIIYEDFKFR